MITSVTTGFYVYRGRLTKEAKKFNTDLVNILGGWVGVGNDFTIASLRYHYK